MRLARLDLGWCGGVADGDVAALARLPALAHLQLARVQAKPAALVFLFHLTSCGCVAGAWMRTALRCGCASAASASSAARECAGWLWHGMPWELEDQKKRGKMSKGSAEFAAGSNCAGRQA